MWFSGPMGAPPIFLGRDEVTYTVKWGRGAGVGVTTKDGGTRPMELCFFSGIGFIFFFPVFFSWGEAKGTVLRSQCILFLVFSSCSPALGSAMS